VEKSFDRFCLMAEIGAIEHMLREDASSSLASRIAAAEAVSAIAGAGPKARLASRVGKVTVHRRRVRNVDDHKVVLPTSRATQAEDWLGR
jgi:hypothetical protein